METAPISVPLAFQGTMWQTLKPSVSFVPPTTPAQFALLKQSAALVLQDFTLKIAPAPNASLDVRNATQLPAARNANSATTISTGNAPCVPEAKDFRTAFRQK